MAIGLGPALVAAGDTAAGPSWTTAALANAPGAGNLIIGLLNQSASTAGTVSSVSGAGITTWGIHGTTSPYSTIAAPGRRVCLVYAQQAGAGTTAAITITMSVAGSGLAWIFFQLTGVSDETASNGLNALVQVVQAASDTATTTPLGSNLATPTTGNALIMGIGHTVSTNADVAARTNWTEIDEQAYATPSNSIEAQWTNTLETSYGATFTTSSVWGAIAAEIKAPVAATTKKAGTTVMSQAVHRASRW